MMGRLFKVRAKVLKTFMSSTMKWRKVTGRKSGAHGTSSPRLPGDSLLDGLKEFPVTKAVDNRVDEWRQSEWITASVRSRLSE